jgi:hypothetical protein
VNVNERMGRLRGLLERVQSRAGAPRVAATTTSVYPSQAQVAPATYAEQPAEARFPSVAPVTAQSSVLPAAHASVRPSVHPSAQPVAFAGSVDSSDLDGDVEVSSEEVEVDIDVDEPEPMESGAQPIAQQSMPPEELEEELDVRPATRPPSYAPAHEEPEEIVAAAPANEIEEPAPSSSRRPIAGEEIMTGVYEEESAPRHTPPPESGKQVAAAPSNQPPHLSSAPPPSLEGHTLIGGWREPGLGIPHVSPAAGVGSARPPAPRQATEPPAVQPPAQASGTRLSPDVTRPEAVSHANVASFAGAPPVARPTTLGELLDLTLSL